MLKYDITDWFECGQYYLLAVSGITLCVDAQRYILCANVRYIDVLLLIRNVVLRWNDGYLKNKCEFMNKYEFMHNADFEVT